MTNQELCALHTLSFGRISGLFNTNYPVTEQEWASFTRLMVEEKKFPVSCLIWWKLGLSPRALDSAWSNEAHQLAGRITIPIWDPWGELVSISGRALYPGQDPKFWHPSFKKREILWAYHAIAHGALDNDATIFLVESFFDVMAIGLAGHPAVAMMGAQLSLRQASLLRRIAKRVVYLPHQDKTDWRSLGIISHTLSTAGLDTQLSLLPRGEDFADFWAIAPQEAARFLAAVVRPAPRIEPMSLAVRLR